MISVIIPTHNASKQLPCLLAKLECQTIKDLELIVIDSSSNDQTVEMVQSRGAKVISIAASQFEHGATRTLGAKAGKGDIVIYLTQDTIPYDEYAIENLIEPITADGAVGAAFGRQLPHLGASLFAQHLRLFNYPEVSYTRVLVDRERHGIKTAFLSNSFAGYRKEALKKTGYFENGLIFGEDTCVAAKMLLSGYKIAYVAEARVFHSHDYSIWEDLKRYFDMGVFHKSEQWFLEEFGRAEGQGIEYVKSEIKFLWKHRRYDLFPELVLRNIVKYLGYGLGSQHVHLPKSVAKRLSMNRSWWDKKCGNQRDGRRKKHT